MSNLLASCVVRIAVLMVLICHLMNLFDQGSGWTDDMVYIVAIQEFGKLIRCERETIISVDKAGWSILGDEFLQVVGQA